jgi:hypothetical protein
VQRRSLFWQGGLLFAMTASCATSPPPEESLPSPASPPHANEGSDAESVDGSGQDATASPNASEEDASRDPRAAAPARDASSQTGNASWPATAAPDAGAAATQEAGSSLPYPPINVSAQDFCSKYQQYCGFGASMRYASMSACISNYNANPQQQGCYNYHLNAAINGTATLCTSPPTAQCFAIHCPHATGMGGYCM